jgi:type IX secretion system PorP/SprF family membrane protein
MALAQDPVFSQYYASPLHLNPGFAGHTAAPFVALNHRRQWPTLGNAYVTSSISYDQFMDKANSGIGFSFLSDNAGMGLWRTSNAALSYSYRVKINRETSVRLGLSAGLLQYRLDWDRLIFYDQLSPSEGYTGQPTSEIEPENNNIARVDLGSGILFYNKKFWVGLSGSHLNSPDFNYISTNEALNNGLSIRWNVTAGYQLTLREGTRVIDPIFLTPTVLMSKQGSAFQANVGVYAGRDPLFGGVFYRHTPNNSDALIAMVGMKVDIFKFAYSYDATVSQLGFDVSGGAHEVSVIFNFDALLPGKDYNDCFELFR